MKVIAIIETDDPGMICDSKGAVHHSSFEDARSKLYDHPLAISPGITLLDLESSRTEKLSIRASDATEKQLTHERDLLGEALGKVLVAAGVLRRDANATGPMLLCAAEEFAEHLTRTRAAKS